MDPRNRPAERTLRPGERRLRALRAGDEFVLTVELPGFDLEAIAVSWDDGVRNVSAEHEDDERGRQRTYHRRFRFPKRVVEEEIEAEYTNGVLEIVLPVEAGGTARGTEIEVQG